MATGRTGVVFGGWNWDDVSGSLQHLFADSDARVAFWVIVALCLGVFLVDRYVMPAVRKSKVTAKREGRPVTPDLEKPAQRRSGKAMVREPGGECSECPLRFLL